MGDGPPASRGSASTPPSKLFPKAVWEKPAHPEKVLYANQMINGLLMQDLNSDLRRATVRIKVTQDVMDRWGLGHVLLAKDSTILMATMEGQAKYGQKRIPLARLYGLSPDGSAICSKGQAGDAMGAAGMCRPTSITTMARSSWGLGFRRSEYWHAGGGREYDRVQPDARTRVCPGCCPQGEPLGKSGDSAGTPAQPNTLTGVLPIR